MSMYEVTPVRIVLPATPTLEATPRALAEVRDQQVIRITGATSLSTTLPDARRKAQAMLDETRARVEGGHPQAILELLDANAAFIAVRWVRETLWRLSREGRLRRRRGRVTGRRRFSPLVVVGLVKHLIQMGEAANPERAFGVLEQAEILKYETAKDLYYRGVREDRFKPILLEFEDLAGSVSEEALRPLLDRAEVLKPGKTIKRKVSDPKLGEVEIQFKAV
jgi:hypothetical protein